MTDSQDLEPHAAADGEFTSRGRPNGYSSLTPFLAVPRAGEALAFYRDVFGARVVGVTEFSGFVAHAELDFGHGRLQLGEPSPITIWFRHRRARTTATRSRFTATTSTAWLRAPSMQAQR